MFVNIVFGLNKLSNQWKVSITFAISLLKFILIVIGGAGGPGGNGGASGELGKLNAISLS